MKKVSLSIIANILEANNIAVPSINDCECDECSCECDYNCDWSFKENSSN